MKITERILVYQDWYETECSKTGWESHGWYMVDYGLPIANGFTIVKHLEFDKFGNPVLGLAEKETLV